MTDKHPKRPRDPNQLAKSRGADLKPAPFAVIASAVLREQPAVAGSAFLSCGAGASLIALLQRLANHGSDHLLISNRQRRDHRSEVLLVFLEDATFTFKQPSEIYKVLDRVARIELINSSGG